MTTSTSDIRVCDLGRVKYLPIWQRMQAFTDARDADTPDEIWFCEHPPVFTQGRNGKPEHLLAPGEIPVVETDRGGQVTYHGPGQLMAYLLIDLNRRSLGPRAFVSLIENSVIDLLAGYGIAAAARADAPGVYVDGAKIAALGLRIRKGRSYHGLSLNLDLDLAPFSRINPCGYSNLPVTRLSDLLPGFDRSTVQEQLLQALTTRLANHH